jgi:hypothetical protein
MLVLLYQFEVMNTYSRCREEFYRIRIIIYSAEGLCAGESRVSLCKCPFNSSLISAPSPAAIFEGVERAVSVPRSAFAS